MLLGTVLLAGPVSSAATPGPSEAPPPWFGARVETDEFALRIPNDWLAVDLRSDVQTQAGAVAAWLSAENERCRGGSCVAALERRLRNEDATVRLLASDLGAVLRGDPSDYPGSCRLHGPTSLYRHPASEYAGVIHDVITSSEDVDTPVTLPAGPAVRIAAGSDLVQVGVYVLEHDERHYHLDCNDGERHDATWREIAESIEFL